MQINEIVQRLLKIPVFDLFYVKLNNLILIFYNKGFFKIFDMPLCNKDIFEDRRLDGRYEYLTTLQFFDVHLLHGKRISYSRRRKRYAFFCAEKSHCH